MDSNPLSNMGPPPFRFVPSREGLTSPAFSITFKVLATLIVFALVAAFAQAWWTGRQGAASTGGGWFIAGLALLLYTWWHIMRSVTRIGPDGLYQSWVWDKHMEVRELAYGKLIRVRGLDWLIAPRLYVRTLMGKFAVFYASSPEMVAEFERLVAELKAFRSFR